MWVDFIAGGARVYHHGKVYENSVAIDLTLRANESSAERGELVRNMISWYNGQAEHLVPQVVEELQRGLTIENTTAGRVLGLPQNQLVISSQSSGDQQLPQAGDGASGSSTANGSNAAGVRWSDLLPSAISGARSALWDFFA